MAKELEKEQQVSKLDAKREAAVAKKAELAAQIEELREKILDEKDEKTKKKLRKTRDELIAQREGIVISDEKVSVPMLSSAKKKLQACIAIVVVLALLVTYVATGAAKHGFLSSLGVPQSIFTGMTLTDAEGHKHGIKVSTYNFYFANYYNNLQSTQSYLSQLGASSDGDYPDFDVALSKQTREDEDGNKQTWAEYAEEQVLDSIKSVYLYYYAAVDANDGKEPEIKESQQEQIDSTIEQYEETASNYGYTVSAYLTAAMGDGVNEKVFRREAKIQYISQNYQEEYTDELNNKEYTDDEYNAYLEENRDDLVSVDVMYYECGNEDDAAAFAAAVKADGSNFAELAAQYSEDETYSDPVETTYYYATRALFQQVGAAVAQADEHLEESEETEETEEEHEHTYSGLDWIFSEDRKAGDVTNHSTSVIYIINPVRLAEDVSPVTIRHILIKPETQEVASDEETAEGEEEEETTTASSADEATDEQWALAEAKAQEVLDTYLAGEQTAEAFGELAKAESEDSNAEDGGIYENVTPNTMVSTFNEWIFDASRQSGDTAIVKTEFGYHVMYFESKSDMPVWKYTAQQALASEDSASVIEEYEDSFTIKKSWPGSCYFEKDTDISN